MHIPSKRSQNGHLTELNGLRDRTINLCHEPVRMNEIDSFQILDSVEVNTGVIVSPEEGETVPSVIRGDGDPDVIQNFGFDPTFEAECRIVFSSDSFNEDHCSDIFDRHDFCVLVEQCHPGLALDELIEQRLPNQLDESSYEKWYVTFFVFGELSYENFFDG